MANVQRPPQIRLYQDEAILDGFAAGPALDLFGTKGRQKLTKKAQTRLVGNSVPPHVAAAIIGANLAIPSEAVA